MYKSKITKNTEGSFYALVVNVESDGYERVCFGYKGRHFKSEKAAINSTSKYILKVS